MTPHPFFADPPPRVLAHRGLVSREAALGGIAENSFAAVAAAHAAGAVYIESDCHVTSDGVVVLFHDDGLERVTGDQRKVAEVTARELELLMAARGGLITLEQALDTFPRVRFNLDVKAGAAAVSVGTLIAPHAERVLVTSFSDARRRRALEAAHAARADIRPATSPGRGTVARILVAVALNSRRLVARCLRDVDALQIPERLGWLRILSDRLIALAHAQGVEVHVWTVNDEARMRSLVARGVDGIVTDRAVVALAVMRAG